VQREERLTMARDAAAIRVLVVDDHEVTRRGVASVLGTDAHISVVAEAGSVGEALARGPVAQPDVAVVAMRLPDGSGAHLCQRLRARVPCARFLVLSRCSDPETVRGAVRAGASGYLVKNVPGAALVAAVHRVAVGQTVFDGTAMAALSAEAERDRLAALTRRERAVLHLIGQGLSNREIGNRLGLTEKTVKNYTNGLLAKLHMSNRTQVAILATRLRSDRRGNGRAE
jgi:DNA-binding NarL/FixJ family response regulator